MSTQASVFIATSLDGFIARENGAIDWLEQANASVPAGEDCGYGQFMDSVDVLVMGSGTFQSVVGFSQWPYGNKPVWVVSNTLQALPPGVPDSVSLLDLSPGQIMDRAQDLGMRRLYLDGGRLIQSFLSEGLVSDLTITTIPVLLGQGRRLFGTLPADLPLVLEASRSYPFGFVQSTYRVLPFAP